MDFLLHIFIVGRWPLPSPKAKLARGGHPSPTGEGGFILKDKGGVNYQQSFRGEPRFLSGLDVGILWNYGTDVIQRDCHAPTSRGSQ